MSLILKIDQFKRKIASPLKRRSEPKVTCFKVWLMFYVKSCDYFLLLKMNIFFAPLPGSDRPRERGAWRPARLSRSSGLWMSFTVAITPRCLCVNFQLQRNFHLKFWIHQEGIGAPVRPPFTGSADYTHSFLLARGGTPDLQISGQQKRSRPCATFTRGSIQSPVASSSPNILRERGKYPESN